MKIRDSSKKIWIVWMKNLSEEGMRREFLVIG
jgi:hypothetical protein